MARIVIGAFIVLFGLGLFVDQFPILSVIGLNFDSISSLFWVVIGVLLLIRRHSFWGMVFLAIGVLGFVSNIFHVNSWSVFFPVIVIAFGISILFKKDNPISSNAFAGSSSEQDLSDSIVFSSFDKKITSKNFTGGKIDAVFSGFKLDLSDAEISEKGATLEINAVFGGGVLIVPKNMKVVSNGTAVMGGWSNQLQNTEVKGAALNITGAAVFGGVELKNS